NKLVEDFTSMSGSTEFVVVAICFFANRFTIGQQFGSQASTTGPLLLHSRSRCTWRVAGRLARSRFAFGNCRHRLDAMPAAAPPSSIDPLAGSPARSSLHRQRASGFLLAPCTRETGKPDLCSRSPM